MLDIDGAARSGSGMIVRQAVAYAAITGSPSGLGTSQLYGRVLTVDGGGLRPSRRTSSGAGEPGELA